MKLSLLIEKEYKPNRMVYTIVMAYVTKLAKFIYIVSQVFG